MTIGATTTHNHSPESAPDKIRRKPSRVKLTWIHWVTGFACNAMYCGKNSSKVFGVVDWLVVVWLGFIGFPWFGHLPVHDFFENDKASLVLRAG